VKYVSVKEAYALINTLGKRVFGNVAHVIKEDRFQQIKEKE